MYVLCVMLFDGLHVGAQCREKLICDRDEFEVVGLVELLVSAMYLRVVTTSNRMFLLTISSLLSL